MQKRRIVKQFHGRREADGILVPGAAGAGGEQGQDRTEQLPGMRQQGPVRPVQQGDVAPEQRLHPGDGPFQVRSQERFGFFEGHSANRVVSSSAVRGKAIRARSCGSSMPVAT